MGCMNRNFKDKLKEVVYFTLCLVFLLAIAYFSGFLKGFTFDDFAYTYQKLVYTISKNVDLDVDRANILSTGNSTARKTSSFNNYRLLTIPQTVINGAYDSNTWLSVFRSNKKVVFSQILLSGGFKWNRTTDTRIFSPLLYQLSYEAINLNNLQKNGDPERARTVDL